MRKGRIKELIRLLKEFRKGSTIHKWQELEKEFRIEEEGGFTLSEILQYEGEEALGKSYALYIRDEWREKRWWQELIGVCQIYVDIYGQIYVESIHLCSPYSIIDADINCKTIYSTVDGYFVLPDWRLLENFEVEYDMILNSEHDGAQRVRIVGKEVE